MAEEAVSEFGSDAWISSLHNLCFDFLKNLQKRPGGQFLRFQSGLLGTRENPGKIVEEYHQTASLFKQGIFGANAKQSHMDHHKIAALYIRSFLIHQPFMLDIPADTKKPELCLYTTLPNEYFAIVYLATIFKGANDQFNGKLQMTPVYTINFIKLLYHYKKNIERLDPASLSNILYLIEQHYFKW